MSNQTNNQPTRKSGGVQPRRIVRQLKGKALIEYRKSLLAQIELESGNMDDESYRLDDPEWPDAEKSLLEAARRLRDAREEHVRTVATDHYEISESNSLSPGNGTESEPPPKS